MSIGPTNKKPGVRKLNFVKLVPPSDRMVPSALEDLTTFNQRLSRLKGLIPDPSLGLDTPPNDAKRSRIVRRPSKVTRWTAIFQQGR